MRAASKGLSDGWVKAADREKGKFIFGALECFQLPSRQLLVFTRIEDQGFVISRFEILHLADVECMVSGGVDVDHLRDKVRQSVLQNRYSATRTESDVESFYRPSGEMITQLLLVLCEDAYAEPASVRQYAVHIGTIVQ